MALVKCRECGTEISSKANACPKCGIAIKHTSLLAKVVLALILICFGFAILGQFSSGTSSSPQPEQTPEEKAKKDREYAQYGAAVAAADSLKKSLRDPDSLKFDSMRVSEDAKVICAEYRAKNGFGGMNRAILVFVDGEGSEDKKVWNKNCAGKMTDQLYAVQ